MLVEFGLGMEGCHYIGSIGQHCLNMVGIRLCLVSDVALGLSKNQKSSFLNLSRVNPGCIFYVDFRNIKFFIIGCHLPCPLFSLNWLLTPL